MFGGFKATLNLFSGKNKKSLQSELSPDMSVGGAYRTSRDDFFGYRNSFDQTKKTTASEQVAQRMRPTKSSSDLTKAKNPTPNIQESAAVDVSRDPRGAEQTDPRNGTSSQKATKNQEKEQKQLEKQRLVEQKARQKQIAQEKAKQEKLRREKEKREAQQAKTKRRPDRKKAAPQPQAAMPVAQASSQYPTNTLDSSISRSSGPPPYTAAISGQELNNAQSQGESSGSSGNVTYKKPEDTGSWDMISQHRQQIIRPTTTIGGGGKQNKKMVMDLNYNFGEPNQQNQDTGKDNSDA